VNQQTTKGASAPGSCEPGQQGETWWSLDGVRYVYSLWRRPLAGDVWAATGGRAILAVDEHPYVPGCRLQRVLRPAKFFKGGPTARMIETGVTRKVRFGDFYPAPDGRVKRWSHPAAGPEAPILEPCTNASRGSVDNPEAPDAR